MQGAGPVPEPPPRSMPSLKKYPHHDRTSIQRLVESCLNLCTEIDGRAAALPAEKGSFLVNNLGDAMRQVELILRVLDEETADSKQKEERKGFLKRLFGREEDEEPSKQTRVDFTLPDFNVSKQGLQGNVATIPMAELLSFLAFSKKTGVLWVDSPDENFLLGMVQGQLMHANSDRTPEGLRLGEILVGLGCLTRRQLERFISQIGKDQPVTGDKLVEGGMISKEELRSALLYQVQQLFHRLVKTKNAMFRFREGMEVMLSHQVSLDINSLLLDNARALDEEEASEVRSEAAAAEWSSWQDELSSKLTSVSREDMEDEEEDVEEKQPERAATNAEPVDGKPASEKRD